MASENLEIAEIQTGQSQKEVTHNLAINLLDVAINDLVSIAITADRDLTTDETRENAVIKLTGTPSAFNLDMPDTNERVLTVVNTTAVICTVRNSAEGGTGQPVIAAGEVAQFHYDGTNFTDMGAGGGGGADLDVKDEGSSVVAAATALNFVGPGVSVADAGGNQADVSIGGTGNATATDAAKPFRGALVFDLSNQSITLNTDTTIAFDAEKYDTDNFHDNVTNNSRLTVPAGVTKVRLSSNALFTSIPGGVQVFFWMAKNGDATLGFAPVGDEGLPATHNEPENFSGQNLVSAVLDVVEGDYFEFRVRTAGTRTLDGTSGSMWFAIEVVESVDTFAFFDRAKLMHVRDEKAAGTDGGTFTLGAYRTRDLNKVVTNEITGASLAANQITLPPGRYYIDARAPALSVSVHKARLRDTTGSADLIIGSSEFNDDTASEASTISSVSGQITLTVESVLELQHQSLATQATNGFGASDTGAGFGDVEVFSEVYIWQMPDLEAGVAIQGALIHVHDEKAATSAGGTATSGSYQTRDLNTVLTNEIASASLATNQITLPPGDYYVEAVAPAFATNKHKLRLQDTTGAATLVLGSHGVAGSADLTETHAFLSGRFNLSVSSVIELQHRFAATKATDGLGTGTSNFGDVEVFSDVRIWKLKTIGSGPKNVDAFFPGTVAGSTLLYQESVTRPFFLKDNLVDSEAFATTAPSGGTAIFDIERNGSAIGTVTFADGVATATFTTTGSAAEFFVKGDRLGIRSQATLNGVVNVSVNLFASFA